MEQVTAEDERLMRDDGRKERRGDNFGHGVYRGHVILDSQSYFCSTHNYLQVQSKSPLG